MSLQFQTELMNQLDEPKRYIVFMLNDDYTSWDFCLRIISSVFHKTIEEADAITNEIHTKGRGFCGIYPYEIAETKARAVEQQAREEGFPMKCAIEEK
ncbi:MAG: ATP-dependent Clp protease adaptor ClpS [Arcobacter sp.]|nr:MAG: ATP-dependent Clp protease adaptor ClpS [Arcobacter sp.]